MNRPRCILATAVVVILGGVCHVGQAETTATALFELAGTDSDAARNLAVYRKAKTALEVSLQLQDKQPNPATGGSVTAVRR